MTDFAARAFAALRLEVDHLGAALLAVHDERNEQGDIVTQHQKVYDKDKECILTITMRNNYLTRDQQGNWTSNSLSLSYWEKGQQSQQTTILQKRTLTYWD